MARYTLTGHVLDRDCVPKNIGRGLPPEIPVVLFGRLALDTPLHGRHLGGALLPDALGRAVQSSHLVAAHFVVVDAVHEKAAKKSETALDHGDVVRPRLPLGCRTSAGSPWILAV